MIKSKKQMFIVIGVFTLVMLLGTVTYAFFNYTRTGPANRISVGRISFVSRQTQTISLTNLFPIDPTETGVMDDDTKVGTLEIEIEGDTDYVDGVEYLISATDANIYTSTGQVVPITLDFTITGLGTSNANYFTERENKNANIYKKLVGDTLVGDQMLLVGFIKPNTTSGQIEGVNGKITIKAYFDKNKIAISDTYDGTESDNMGTTNNWVDDRVVITTNEWNAREMSFKVKVEANEGIWVKGSLEEIMKRDNIGIDTENGVDFNQTSDEDGTKGVYMRAGTTNDINPIMYYRGAVENNNVVFANKCWKAVRTTDTGGIKMIYNGEYNIETKCNNSGLDSQITLNINETDTNTFSFNVNDDYIGYMYGDLYSFNNGIVSNSYYSKGFTWDGTEYTLSNDATNTKGDSAHYSCGIANIKKCESIRYYYYKNYYIVLSNGESVEVALKKMESNINDSNAKDKLDMWYVNNILSYTNKLDDTIWCNDRSANSNENDYGSHINSGWNSDGGNINNYLYFAPYGRVNNSMTYLGLVDVQLSCSNKNDRFSVNNSNGNKKLDYSIGMLTIDEVVLAGGKDQEASSFYLNSGSRYWTMSPYFFSTDYTNNYCVFEDGSFFNTYVDIPLGLRPVISIKPGQLITEGDGTSGSPYIIK